MALLGKLWTYLWYKEEDMEGGLSICWKLDVEDNSWRRSKQIIFVPNLVLLYMGNDCGIRKMSMHAAKHLFADERDRNIIKSGS